MDLVRPALTALGVWIGVSLLAGLVMAVWATPAQVTSPVGMSLWVVIPQFLVGGLSAALAAYVHRRPFRDEPGRHALAALGPVGVLAVLQVGVNVLTETYPWSIVGGFAANAVGGVLGWLVVSRLVRREERHETGSRYF